MLMMKTCEQLAPCLTVLRELSVSQTDHCCPRRSYTVQTTAKTIPIRWTAPEALVHLEYHTASDVWSYGVLMWEIFTGGKLPYAGLTNSQVHHILQLVTLSQGTHM